MKIHFLVFDIFGMGGTGRTVLNVANYLAQQQYDIEIISVFRHRNKGFFEIDPRIKVTVLHDLVERDKNQLGLKTKIANKLSKMKSRLIHPDDEAHHFFSLLTDIKMYSYIKSINSGILITTRPSFNIFATKYANKGIPIVGQEHLNFQIYPDRLKESIMKSYPKLNYLITLTDDDTDDYQKLFEGTPLKIKKITNSVPPLNGKISNLEEKVIMAAGRLAPQKGFDLLIESFRPVVAKHPDWKLKIFGFGREKNNLQDLIHHYGLYNNVFLMGPTKNIDVELSNSSIYALSSRFEGFGMVIVEAMQCGVPVISFDCPKGPAEIIKNNQDGLLIKDGDVDAFTEGLMTLIEDKEKQKRFARLGLKNVKRYEIKNIGRLWEELVKELEGSVK
ncbi:glycosyltransferase family 4 protein [Bacillus wiedmannii]|uniref:glycosyltransferase family 4 protein n=1 Tax=Bacillus wiedmannii TaxID=1890302 RepID=UPI000BF76FF2|nr:glycosyltransferase family 4 protein [Bacillus wiedmannii]PGE25639.1 UDP-glucose--polyglycerol phosphate glucosyltransferase [Bacillus wiedmannii]